jgi:RpiR family carbohydrate utilization transcriptional regulator
LYGCMFMKEEIKEGTAAAPQGRRGDAVHESVNHDDVIGRIYRKEPYLTPLLRRVAAYVLKHPNQCKNMTIKRLSLAAGVAESTVTRFVRDVGLQSFQALKIDLAQALTASELKERPGPERLVYGDIARDDSIPEIVEKTIYRNVQTLTEARERLDVAELARAVRAVEKAATVIFSCMGSSSVAAEEGVMRFTRAGKKCLLFRDESIQLMTAAIAGPHDLVIGLSNSGFSIPVIESLKFARARGASTIAVTSFEDSPLVKHADVALFTPTKSSPSGPGLFWEATASKIAQILVIDLLCACFTVRHFDETIQYLEETFRAVKSTRRT